MVTENAQAKEKMVTIRLPRTAELTNDVRVRINERTWQIQRGVDVKVPERVAKVIRNSERMEQITLDFNDANRAKED